VVLRELVEIAEVLVHLEDKVHKDLRVRLAHKVIKAHRVRKVRLAHKDFKVPVVLVVRAEILDQAVRVER
jgi:hypothetical protein